MKKPSDIVKRLYKKYLVESVLMRRFAGVASLDILVRASNFFLLPVYLKLMTQDEYGLYGYLFSIIGMFSLVCNFGIYLAQNKLYHDYDDARRGALLFTMNTALIVMLTAVLLPAWIFELDKPVVDFLFKQPIRYDAYRGLLFLATVVTMYSQLIYNFFITSEKVKTFQLYNLVKLVAVNGLVIYILYASTADAVLLRLKYTYITELALLSVFSILYFKHMRFSFDTDMAKRTLVIGMPAMLTALVGMIYQFSDRFFLEKYYSFKELAIYEVAFKVAAVLMIVFQSFQSVYLPFFYKEKNAQKSFAKVKQILAKMVPIFLLLGAGLTAALQIAIELAIVEQSYQQAVYVLPFLAVTQMLLAASHLMSNYVVYFEMVYIGTIIVFVLSLLRIGLNLLLVPDYGVYGAAVSALLISILSFATYTIFAKLKCANAPVPDSKAGEGEQQ